MFRRIVWIVVILVLSVTVAYASGDESEPTPIILLSPLDQAVVADPNIVFTWLPVDGVTTYKLKVRSPGFSYKADLAATACTDSACAYSPLGDPDWKPPYGAILKWSVSAKLDHGKAKSAAWLVFTDFLPTPALFDPGNGVTITTTLVTFSWSSDGRVGEYALVLKIPKEGKSDPLKFTPGSICDANQCLTTVDLVSFDGKARSGEYQWWVAAARDSVKGKAKSEKRIFVADLLPKIVAYEPADGLYLNTSVPLFYWDAASGIEEYRVVVEDAVGGKITTDWFTAAQVCDDGDCEVESLVLANNTYTWHVEGRISTLDGLAKSDNLTFIVYVPEATEEPLPRP